MKIASIIYSLILMTQAICAGCPNGPGPCAPCCATMTCGGPPPPPGFPIDNYIYALFFVGLVFGAYIINKKQKQA